MFGTCSSRSIWRSHRSQVAAGGPILRLASIWPSGGATQQHHQQQQQHHHHHHHPPPGGLFPCLNWAIKSTCRGLANKLQGTLSISWGVIFPVSSKHRRTVASQAPHGLWAFGPDPGHFCGEFRGTRFWVGGRCIRLYKWSTICWNLVAPGICLGWLADWRRGINLKVTIQIRSTVAVFYCITRHRGWFFGWFWLISAHRSKSIAVSELRSGTINKHLMPCKHIPYSKYKTTNMLLNILNYQKTYIVPWFILICPSTMSSKWKNATGTSAVTDMAPSTPSWGHRLRSCSGFWTFRSLAATLSRG